MCILFIAVRQHPDFPLIIAANRDEFTERPTLASNFWDGDNRHILAGKDLQAGGTWMGINTQGNIAALTNIRDPKRIIADAKTRGALVADYLLKPTDTYVDTLRETAESYNGYNLLFGHWSELMVYNNHLNTCVPLDSGFYGLSNADLNSPWPKINKGVKALKDYCLSDAEVDHEQLFTLLRDETRADDAMLPDTGVPLELGKATFINFHSL